MAGLPQAHPPGECLFARRSSAVDAESRDMQLSPTATAPWLSSRPMIDKVEVVHAAVVQTDGLLVDLALVCIAQTPGRSV